MSDIGAPARTAYETGTSPVAFAIAGSRPSSTLTVGADGPQPNQDRTGRLPASHGLPHRRGDPERRVRDAVSPIPTGQEEA